MPIVGMFYMPHPPIIISEIGRDQALEAKQTINACEQVARLVASLSPDTIILVSPHAQMHPSLIKISEGLVFSGDFRSFGYENLRYEFSNDMHLVNTIIQSAAKTNMKHIVSSISDVGLDHGTLVPLYFITKQYNKFKLVRINPSFSSLNKHQEFGMFLSNYIPENKRVVLIGSGDLSHTSSKASPYGFKKEGKQFDSLFVQATQKNDLSNLFNLSPYLINKAAVCGLQSLAILFGASKGFKIKLLSYENPFGIGYAVISFDAFKMYDYVSLAKASLHWYLIHGSYLRLPDNLLDEMKTNRNGVFVSIHKHNQLRGCIGTIISTQKNVALEIIHNAVSAGIKDPRFTPIKLSEWNDLIFSVDVLSPPVRCQKSDLNPKKYGVIVKKDFRTGVLLPNLPSITNTSQQLNIALQKAGIHPNENFTIERFEVKRYHEKK